MQKQFLISILTMMVFLFSGIVRAESQNTPANGLSVSGQWFLAYQTGKTGDTHFNQFLLKRGYINIKQQLAENISGRITPDISVDHEGDGRGDIELRLKYCYLKYDFPSIGFLTKPYVEFGLVHRPWIDFEEHINLYRVQGTMFLERNGIFNSADYGLTFVSLLGGEIDKDYQKNISKSYPGKYGSLAVGIYNGGGYHAIEENQNKTLESRLSLRPLPAVLPGFQITYQGVYGKGNLDFEPDWNFHSAFVSLESDYFIGTATWYAGNGDAKGKAIDANQQALPNNGYSLFSEVRLGKSPFSIIGRYDNFYQETAPNTGWENTRYIVGLAYEFYKGNQILIDYDRVEYKDIDKAAEQIFEFVVEVHY